MSSEQTRALANRAPIRLYVLGPIKIERDGKSISFSRRKVQALLAYLALYPQEHPREHLAALFWGDSTDEASRLSLRVALNLLRKEIGFDLILADRETVALNPELTLWLDAREMQDAAIGSDLERQIAAVELYRGELLAGHYQDWVLRAREEYRSLYLDTLLQIVQSLRASGEYAKAIPYARLVLAIDRANEHAHQQLIFCLWKTGDRHAALAQFEECKNAMAEELGVEPSSETLQLVQRIKSSAPSGLRSYTLPTNLPTPLTSFIGREHVLETLQELVRTTRLLTLSGPGGCGKTRLAIQVAHRVLDSFRDGVWWIDLGVVQDPLLVPKAVIRALGLEGSGSADPIRMLVQELWSKQLLLVMDNCEHLIDACAQLAESLLLQCPNIQILATSREPLNLVGEVGWLVPTLSAPRIESGATLTPQQLDSFESVRLFMERARAARPDFALTSGNAYAVSEICARLDGIPLALELAAARLRALSIQDIAARLDDRFHLLSGGTRTALPRQQTLRNLTDWSYQLLSTAEQILFQRLGVFVGGFDLPAIEEVCSYPPLEPGESADLLARLVDKSLVNLMATNPSRYAMLETFRAYALEQLTAARGESLAREHHAHYYMKLATGVEASYATPIQHESVNWQEQNYPNTNAALEWALENGKTEQVLKAIVRLRGFWFERNYFTEGEIWVTRVLELMPKETPLVVSGLQLAGAINRQQGNRAQAAIYLDKAYEIARRLEEKGKIGWEFGSLYKELGTFARDSGDYIRAIQHLERSLEILRAHEKSEMIESLLFLADVRMRSGDLAASRPLWQEAVARSRALKLFWYLGWALGGSGEQARFENKFDEAIVHLTESLRLKIQTRDLTGIAFTLETMANVAAQQNNPERAATLWGAAERLREEIHTAVPPTYQADYEPHIAQVRAQLGTDRFSEEWTRGRKLMLDEALAMVLTRE